MFGSSAVDIGLLITGAAVLLGLIMVLWMQRKKK